jgi:hypothetical protein
VRRGAALSTTVGAIRLLLAALALAAAASLAADRDAVLVAFAAGAVAVALLASARVGRPTRTLRRPKERSFVRAIGASLLPSTVGVTILAVVALFFDPLLAAALAGVLAGLGAAALTVAAAAWARPPEEERPEGD